MDESPHQPRHEPRKMNAEDVSHCGRTSDHSQSSLVEIMQKKAAPVGPSPFSELRWPHIVRLASPPAPVRAKSFLPCPSTMPDRRLRKCQESSESSGRVLP